MAEDTATTTTTTDAVEDKTTTTSTTDAQDERRKGVDRDDNSTEHKDADPGKTGEEASPDEEHAKMMQDARRLGLRNAARDQVNNTDVADPEHLRQKAQVKAAEKHNRDHDKRLAEDKATAEETRSDDPSDYKGTESLTNTESNTSASK